jgi:hypothetical protein
MTRPEIAMITPKRKPCYALNCTEQIPLGLVVCGRHWLMLGPAIRDTIQLTQQEAQGGLGPVCPYLTAITWARLYIAIREHCSVETMKQLEAERNQWKKGTC